ncbi:unnamed protein product [Closterium sp. NIES-64]|nr:unnamed protein product [Closterium sp. NIES-64]
MIPGLAPVVSPNSPVSLGRGWGSQRVNSAGGSTGQPNHTQRGWGPMASAGGGRAGAQPGGSNMGDRSQSNASGGGMNGVALGAAPSGRSSGSRGPDAAASTGSQRPVAVPRPGIGAGMPRPRAVASVEPVKEPVRVKSPEEIACDFINAETGGWQSHCKAQKILTCSFPPISVIPPALLSAWQSHCKAQKILTCSFPPSPSRPCLTLCLAEPLQGKADSNLLLSPHLRYPPCVTLCLAETLQGVEETLQGVEETLQGVEEPLQGTEDPNLLLSPHLRLAPALLSAWQSHCKARKILTCSFPPISVPPLPYSLPGRNTAGRRRTTAGRRRATAGRRRATAGRRRTTAGQEWGPGWHVDDNTMWPFSSEIFNAGIFAASVRSGMALGVWKTRQIAFALFALEYPILEKTADGKLSSKPDYNLPLYEEKVKWCRRWVEHAVTNLGVGYVEDRDVFVFGNGILIDASDYAAGFKKTTIVLQ